MVEICWCSIYIIIQLVTYCLDATAVDAVVPGVASVAKEPGAVDDDLSVTWFILSTYSLNMSRKRTHDFSGMVIDDLKLVLT